MEVSGKHTNDKKAGSSVSGMGPFVMKESKAGPNPLSKKLSGIATKF